MDRLAFVAVLCGLIVQISLAKVLVGKPIKPTYDGKLDLFS